MSFFVYLRVMAKTDIKVEKQKKKRDSTEIVKKSPVKKIKTTENSKLVNGKESSSKKIKTENGKVKDIQPAKFSAGSIKNILTRAGYVIKKLKNVEN